jgi:hypothetical protein
VVPKTVLQEIVIVNEPISQNEENKSNNIFKKTFKGRDIIDKIYFPPIDSVVVFNQNELNKIGIILLDYLKLQKNYDLLKTKHEESEILNKEENKMFSIEKTQLQEE